MIVADTSVWIAFFRGRDRRVALHFRDLLDRDLIALVAPVRLELLAGASRADFSRLSRLLSALPLYYPTEATWRQLDSWVFRAVSAGERFGIGDLLIGAIAAERNRPVWSLDSDFARMARLDLIELHDPVLRS